MSGPVETCDAKADPAGGPVIAVEPSREARVGDTTVRRALPRRGRRTVGAWCFADHMGPVADGGRAGHRHRPPPPHRPADGHLAGRGRDAASRQPRRRAADPPRPAQPHDRGPGRGPRRGGDRPSRPGRRSTASSSGWPSPRRPATASPPSSTTPSCPGWPSTRGEATVLVGELAGVTSPARADTDHVGAELALRRGNTIVPAAARATSTRSSCWRAPSTWATTRSSSPGTSPTSAPAGTSSPMAMTDAARVMLLGGDAVRVRDLHVVELRRPHP